MTHEKKQEYTLRITQANPSALVVINYEIFFDLIQEAKEYMSKDEKKDAALSLDKARQALNMLIDSLNMDQDPAPAIYQVYLYVSAMLGRTRGSMKPELMDDPIRLMRSLYETYKADSAGDDSSPVMDNSQKVYAGLTYGKGILSEDMSQDASRGFFV